MMVDRGGSSVNWSAAQDDLLGAFTHDTQHMG